MIAEPIEITLHGGEAAEDLARRLEGADAYREGARLKLVLPPDPACLARFLELLATARTETTLPEHVLPIRVSSSQAVSLGYRPDAAIASVFVTNARVSSDDAMLIPDARLPVVAVAAEHGRILQSLSPPSISRVDLQSARKQGVPTIRMPRVGFFARGVRLARRPAGSELLAGSTRARANAEHWLGELDRAWQGRVRSVALVGWPVYPARDPAQGALDATDGNLLPPAANVFTR